MTAPTNSVSSPDKINTAVFQEQAPMTPTDQKTNEAWQGCTRAEEIPPTSPQVVFNLDERLKALESALLKTEKGIEKALEKGVEKGIEEIKKMLENAPSNPYQIVSKDEKTIEEAIKLLEEASVITGINKDKKIIEVKKDEAIGFFQNFGRLALEGVKFTRDLSIIAAIGGTLLILFFPPAREKFCVVVGKILLKIVVPVIDLGTEKLESAVQRGVDNSVKAQLPGLTDAIQRGVEAGSPSSAIV